MKINRTCCAAILLIGSSPAAFGQPGDFPPTATPRLSVPDGASTESRGPDQRDLQGLVPRVSRPVEQPRWDAKTSHPDQIHSQLGLIAEQLTAAGLIDEARQLQGLQRRVSDEYHERLLTTHKTALAQAVVPQISLRVRWVEVCRHPKTTPMIRALFEGLEQGTPSPDGSPLPGTFSGVFTTAEISALIDELDKQGLAKVLAEPQLILLNGRTAQFRQGFEIDHLPPVKAAPAKGGSVVQANATNAGSTNGTEALDGEFSDQFVGTAVRATAVVAKDNLIKLSISTELSELAEMVVLGAPPHVNRQRVQTEVDVRNGQTLVLSGCLSQQSATEVTRIPVLGSIPGIGRLFSSKKTRVEERQLLIVITPEIVRPLDAHEIAPVPDNKVPRPVSVETAPARK